jgi:hypothetical protein
VGILVLSIVGIIAYAKTTGRANYRQSKLLRTLACYLEESAVVHPSRRSIPSSWVVAEVVLSFRHLPYYSVPMTALGLEMHLTRPSCSSCQQCHTFGLSSWPTSTQTRPDLRGAAGSCWQSRPHLSGLKLIPWTGLRADCWQFGGLPACLPMMCPHSAAVLAILDQTSSRTCSVVRSFVSHG